MSTSEPARQIKVDLNLVAIAAALAAAAFFAFKREAVAPAPVVIQPAAPVPDPEPKRSPCGPNRCPYNTLVGPFAATCPFCRNRLVAYPPTPGNSGTLVADPVGATTKAAK